MVADLYETGVESCIGIEIKMILRKSYVFLRVDGRHVREFE